MNQATKVGASLFFASMIQIVNGSSTTTITAESNENGQFRMESGVVKSHHGGLVDSIRDTQFKLSSQENTNPLRFDAMRIFRQEREGEQLLKAKVR